LLEADLKRTSPIDSDYPKSRLKERNAEVNVVLKLLSRCRRDNREHNNIEIRINRMAGDDDGAWNNPALSSSCGPCAISATVSGCQQRDDALLKSVKLSAVTAS